MKRPPGRRSLRFRLVATAVILLAFGIGAELFAREVGPQVPTWRGADSRGVVMTAHPTRLWGLTEGKRFNGKAFANINAQGMRGAMPELPRPAGRQRILMLGDSTWFGHGVNDDETFPAQLEVRLKNAGIDVDVVNGAVPGYSTEQSLLELEEQGWSVEPTLLLVGSLWSDNTTDTFKDADLLKTVRAAKNPLFKSAFFRLLATWIDDARGGTGARLVTYTRKSEWPTTIGRRVPIQDYAANLDRMAREAAERGIGIAYISPCNIGMVQGKYQDGASWNVYFDTQAAVAAHHAVPLIATLPAMKAAGGDPERLFVDVMHPSPEGHGIFAETAATALIAAGWPADPLVAKGGPFPTADLKDRATQVGQPATGSPQRNLFESVDDPDPTARTAVDEGRPATPTGSPVQGPPGGASRWSVQGTVEGGTPPFTVEILRDGGGAASSAHLGAAGPFSLSVRGDLDVATVRVHDASGATDEAKVTHEDGPVTLRPR